MRTVRVRLCVRVRVCFIFGRLDRLQYIIHCQRLKGLGAEGSRPFSGLNIEALQEPPTSGPKSSFCRWSNHLPIYISTGSLPLCLVWYLEKPKASQVQLLSTPHRTFLSSASAVFVFILTSKAFLRIVRCTIHSFIHSFIRLFVCLFVCCAHEQLMPW